MKTGIAVFCYKRAAKLKRSMEALLRNPECAGLEVVFFSDGYKGEGDKQGVLQTRAYIDTLQGFSTVTKQYRSRNLSTGPNFHQGLTYMCERFDQFIVVEDDLVVAPNYLRFLLDALDFYRQDKDVFSISGFCFPLRKQNYVYDTVMHERFCCYGWASWSDRVREVVWDESKLLNMMSQSPRFKQKLDAEGMDLFRTLRKQVTGTISTWDIQMQVQVAQHDMKVVYPVVSKAGNIGFDNESTNTFGVDYLKTVVDEGRQRQFRFCEADSISRSLQQQLRKPYSFPALAARKIANTWIKMTAQVKKAES